MLNEIRLKEIPDIRAAVIYHIGHYKDIRFANENLSSWVKENNIKTRGPLFNLYFDNPKEAPLEKLRSAACIEVDESAESFDKNVTIETLPGQLFASYTVMNEAGLDMSGDYIEMFKWIQANGYVFNKEKPSREICKSKHDNMKTVEILLPVSKSSA